MKLSGIDQNPHAVAIIPTQVGMILLLRLKRQSSSEHFYHVRQQTIGNADIVPHIFAFLDNRDLVRVSKVCHLWKSSVFSDHFLEQKKRRILSFIDERTYGESFISLISSISIADQNSTVSLVFLDDIWRDNEDLFPVTAGSAHEYAKHRVEYSIGLICGSEIWRRHNPRRGTASDDFILEDSHTTKFSDIQHITFLSTLLKKSREDFIFLNGTYFKPLERMTEEGAGILGEGVGCSSLQSIQLKNVYYIEHPKSLPTFLNRAAKNSQLKCVNLCDVGYELDENVIDTLIQEMPNGLTFELILPCNLVFKKAYGGNIFDYNPVENNNSHLQKKLTQHFGEKIKFSESNHSWH